MIVAAPLAGDGGLAPMGYGWALLRLLLALGVVCLLAFVTLKLLQRRLRGGPTPGLLRVLDRLPLGPRQQLWLVEVGGRVFLLGASDGGIARLAELEAGSLPETGPSSSSFAQTLARLTRPRTEDTGAALGPSDQRSDSQQ